MKGGKTNPNTWEGEGEIGGVEGQRVDGLVASDFRREEEMRKWFEWVKPEEMLQGARERRQPKIGNGRVKQKHGKGAKSRKREGQNGSTNSRFARPTRSKNNAQQERKGRGAACGVRLHLSFAV